MRKIWLGLLGMGAAVLAAQPAGATIIFQTGNQQYDNVNIAADVNALGDSCMTRHARVGRQQKSVLERKRTNSIGSKVDWTLPGQLKKVPRASRCLPKF